jgi:hypothetical protein
MNDLESLRTNAQKAVDAFTQESASTASASIGQPWNPWLKAGLTLFIIGFAIVVLFFMRSMLKDGHTPGDVLRLATMPMVIAAAIFLVLLGYSNEQQMTPVIGSLGTMIGYVLGSATQKANRPPNPPT